MCDNDKETGATPPVSWGHSAASYPPVQEWPNKPSANIVVLRPFKQRTMAGSTTSEEWCRRNKLMFVEGTFEELAREFAEAIGVVDEVNPLLEQRQNDEVLKKLVVASTALHTMPEAQFQPAYNMLLYLVFESPNYKIFLPKICEHLCSKQVSSSPVNGPLLAIFELQNIFNLLNVDSDMRYNAFGALLRFVKEHGQFEGMKQWIHTMPRWFELWGTKPEDQRILYVKIADTAIASAEQGPDAAQIKSNEQAAYQSLQSAISLYKGDEASSEEAQKLALRVVRMGLLSSHKYTFSELTVLPAVQALADSHPIWNQLLEIFCEQDLEDYVDFLDEHPDFIEKEGLDGDKLQEKMRLLTFTSLAASAQKCEVEYKHVSKALQVPIEEVEVWAIDAIRAGLVEGKLNQKRQIFGVHRATYRVLSEKQWREILTRVNKTKQVLKNIVAVIDKGEKDVDTQLKRDAEEMTKKLNGAGFGSDNRTGGAGGNRRREYQRRQENDD
ncbi:hypothetical protein MKZ38_002828 [Zalerion maritima]|uniref:Eukaryotic translation initiation factor 3 subunit M n=1 Tax=Zalerion maritima TaxID=339359 RepID=A0AAD5RPQ7_9PEZI|nr:hypothetical protein MKZ38_002828 [Zalerion maritima]